MVIRFCFEISHTTCLYKKPYGHNITVLKQEHVDEDPAIPPHHSPTTSTQTESRLIHVHFWPW